MLDVGANEYNLGPLPGSTVGNPAIAVPLSTTWAVCITPYIPREKYLSNFKSTTGKSHSEIAQAIGGAEFINDDNIISDEGLKTIFDDFVVSQPPEEPVEGDSLDVQIAISGSGASYVFFKHGDAVEVDIPFLPAGHETTIKLTDADSPIWSATLDESILEKAPSPGTELTVEILDNDGSTAYGLHESVPVFLPDCPASEGNYVHAAVTSRVSNGVEASVSSLPEDERLSTGDSFELELDLSPNDSATTLVHEGLPVQISPPIFPVNETVPVTITEVETNRVTAEVDFTEQSGSEFEVGQELSINQLEQRQNKLIGKYDDVPITFSITEEPPTVPDSLDVTIQEISPEEISATIQDHSRLRSLQSGDVITVKINREQGDYLIGKYHGFPVWIPFDGKAIPSDSD